MLNHTVLLGRTTKDIELKYSQSNKAYTRFTVAVNRTFKSANGEYEADFINCITYGKNAENMSRYVNKGDRIIIEGRIQTGSYEDQNGKRVYTTDVVCDNVQFLEPKKPTVEPTPTPREQAQRNVDVDEKPLPF